MDDSRQELLATPTMSKKRLYQAIDEWIGFANTLFEPPSHSGEGGQRKKEKKCIAHLIVPVWKNPISALRILLFSCHAIRKGQGLGRSAFHEGERERKRRTSQARRSHAHDSWSCALVDLVRI